MVDQTLLQHLFATGAAGFDAPDDKETADAAARPDVLETGGSQTGDNAPNETSILSAGFGEAPGAASAAPGASAAIIERGDGGDDVIRGTVDDDLLLGLGGNVRLIGRAGDDTLNGAGGNDKLQGGGGADLMIGGGGDDSLFGGGGEDNIKGGGGADTIRGGGGADTIKGNGGEDTIKGNGGDDSIIGGGGADLIIAGPGNDTIKGGGGNDILQFSQSDVNRSPLTTIKAFQTGRDKVDLQKIANLGPFSSLDIVDGDRGAELRIGDSVILFQGRAKSLLSADDFLLAIDEPSEPPNEGGDPPDPDPDPDPDPVDQFLGTAGDDTINGDAENNLIQGLGGADVLAAGEGLDTLVGGAGRDKFVVRLVDGAVDPEVDIVRDFSYISGDRIGLTEVLSGVPFSDIRDVFRATPQNGDTIIAVKPGGDASVPFQDVLRLEGVTFTTEQLLTHGITAPAVNSTTFVENPYGFQNRSLGSANPDATKDGAYVVWVDRLNLDDSPFDFTVVGKTNGDSRHDQSSTRDIFLLNTQTNVLQRVTDREGDDSDLVEAVSPVVSADGRFVAYVEERIADGSGSSSFGDVYIRDMAFPETDPVLVSVGNDGEAGEAGTPVSNSNRGSNLDKSSANVSLPVVDISDDGRKIAFVTRTSLDSADTDGNADVYLRDLDAGVTRLISADDSGSTSASNVKISGDGRYIGFISSFGFDPTDQDGSADVYLFDTETGQYLLISTPIGGGISGFDMSAAADRFVFSTVEAINPNDTNDLRDIYVADVDLSAFAVTSRQRVSEAEGQFELRDGDSYRPTISQDGDKVAFLSQSQTLIPFRDDFYEQSGSSNFAEKLFLLDLPTGEITLPTIDAAVGPSQEELSTHLTFTDLGFVYRPLVETDSSNGGSGGAIVNGVEQTSDADDIGTVTIDRSEVVRSSIDSASDVDIFRIQSKSSTTRDLFVSIEALDTGVGTLADPQVRVLKKIGSQFVVTNNADNSGLAIDTDSGVGRDAFVGFDTSTNGDRFIEVSSQDGSTGSYVLRVSQTVEPLDGPLPTPDDFIF